MDWSSKTYAADEHGWEYWEAQECDCGAVLVFPGDDDRHRKGVDADDEADWCDISGNEERSEGPMMNYAYPMPNSRDRDPRELAAAIVDLPLCVVRLSEDEDYSLALTGGGMDLSWEICAAFVRCGYLPPVHFADLPRMAGRGQSPGDRRLIARCKESSRVAARWAANTARNLRLNFPAKKAEQRGAA